MATKEPVLDPIQAKIRYLSGEFGNKFLTWKNLDEFFSDPNVPETQFAIISIEDGSKVVCPTKSEVEFEWKNLEFPPILTDVPTPKQNRRFITVLPPFNAAFIQGIISCTENFELVNLELTFSRAEEFLDDALEIDNQHLMGKDALDLIRMSMDITSQNQLRYLLKSYPNHLIEFGSYAGIMYVTKPELNTVFFNVRGY